MSMMKHSRAAVEAAVMNRSATIGYREEMGLLDIFRSLRGTGTPNGGNAEEDISGADPATEPTWFQPRTDGSYDARCPAVGGGVRLRFLPGGTVLEFAGSQPTSDAEQSDPCRGEYTAAGRFTVQRRFERMISYAILEMTGNGFDARRINGADGSTAQLSFQFHPGGIDLADRPTTAS